MSGFRFSFSLWVPWVHPVLLLPWIFMAWNWVICFFLFFFSFIIRARDFIEPNKVVVVLWIELHHLAWRIAWQCFTVLRLVDQPSRCWRLTERFPSNVYAVSDSIDFFKANLPGFSGGTRGNGNPTAPLMKKLGTRRKENEGKLNFTEWKKMKMGFLKSRNKLKLEPNQKRDSYSKFSIDSIVYFYQLNRSIRLKLTKSWKETSSTSFFSDEKWRGTAASTQFERPVFYSWTFEQ